MNLKFDYVYIFIQNNKMDNKIVTRLNQVQNEIAKNFLKELTHNGGTLKSRPISVAIEFFKETNDHQELETYNKIKNRWTDKRTDEEEKIFQKWDPFFVDIDNFLKERNFVKIEFIQFVHVYTILNHDLVYDYLCGIDKITLEEKNEKQINTALKQGEEANQISREANQRSSKANWISSIAVLVAIISMIVSIEQCNSDDKKEAKDDIRMQQIEKILDSLITK